MKDQTSYIEHLTVSRKTGDPPLYAWVTFRVLPVLSLHSSSIGILQPSVILILPKFLSTDIGIFQLTVTHGVMSTFSLFSYTIIQGDMYHIDGSQRTTNMDSFNVITTLAGQPSAPESPLESNRAGQFSAPETPLESTPRASFDDVSSPSANTMPHQQSGGILQTESVARRTSTSSSMSVEDVYPPSRVFTQDLNIQRAAYPYSNRSTDSLEVPESLGARIRNTPAEQKLCHFVFNKLKGWFNGFLGCLQ